MTEPSLAETAVQSDKSKINTLVLDATPLITLHVSTLLNYAHNFYTTPTVFKEIKDENARKNLALWGDKLQLRHPKPESIKRINEFARLTGDAAVLSVNDIHIIALAYELEVESNNGDWRLRKYPGEKLAHQLKQDIKPEDLGSIITDLHLSDEPEKKKKQRRRGGKKQREKREAALQAELEKQDDNSNDVDERVIDQATELLDSLKLEETPLPKEENSPEELQEEYNGSDDDGEWISEENLIAEMIKHSGQKTEQQKDNSKIKVALATGDFAVQNTSLQLGLNLMNILSGLQIKRIRNYMLRCHGCFTMVPIPKDGSPKHFCPRCGGNTLIRCAVSVDATTGEIKAHLKSNFQWHRKGEKYSLASPLSKNTQKRLGNKGFVHNKTNKQKEYEEPILREDQKEYQKALKDDDWLRRKNEKVLNDYIGGGSADNFISPFVAQSYRTSGVRIGQGRYANANKSRKR